MAHITNAVEVNKGANTGNNHDHNGINGIDQESHVGLKFTDFKPSFVRQYANLADISAKAITNYVHDVRDSNYPNNEESFHLSKEEAAALLSLIGTKNCS